ncbi:MAG: 1-acyl-sn-glycerol-3-phosphate acyltransferase [Campylobacterota bacterium]|nr:1-acyl-sn-glycerol-3-phosphate acyltransferase [Campylobacterota bacterium]
MDLKAIGDRILTLSFYIKKIEVLIKDDAPYAIIYPDFEALKKANIINIESEIRWYGVELYNMEVDDSHKVLGYEIISKKIDSKEQGEEDNELYLSLKSYISTLSSEPIYLSSHLELDLGLDSLNYVELFVYIEQSFGVVIDEVLFSKIMTMKELYEYVKKNQTKFNPTTLEWKNILDEKIDKKLIYSPIIMGVYKIVLLPLFKLYFSLEVKGQENIPKTRCIIAPIHQSMLDGFLILATLPFKVLKRSFFLSFKQVFGRGIFKPIAENSHNILIDANEHLKQTMQYSAMPLKEGANLVIFPEGARTRDGKLLEFRVFYTILSATYNTPIVPVVLEGAFDALKTGTIFPLPRKIKVTYLKPIYPEGLSYDEINQRVREAIIKGI